MAAAKAAPTSALQHIRQYHRQHSDIGSAASTIGNPGIDEVVIHVYAKYCVRVMLNGYRINNRQRLVNSFLSDLPFQIPIWGTLQSVFKNDMWKNAPSPWEI